MLIATLPNVTRVNDIDRMVNHPLIDGVRYNVGMRSPYSPQVTLEKLMVQVNKAGKKLWVDIKGRQLRITQWADPTYGDIVLNHPLCVDLPAKIIFRGGKSSNVVAVNGERIYVEPSPTEALGAGQAVNIIGSNLKIEGYLTPEDVRYIKTAQALGVDLIMASFVEELGDLEAIWQLNPKASIVLKIESQKGLELAKSFGKMAKAGTRLMLARDDLMVNIGRAKPRILQAAEMVITQDPEAIVASHLLTSLERGSLTAADISDLDWLHRLGYRNFMLSDTISHYFFKEAMEIWGDYLAAQVKT